MSSWDMRSLTFKCGSKEKCKRYVCATICPVAHIVCVDLFGLFFLRYEVSPAVLAIYFSGLYLYLHVNM
jgi:hypothetical protein